MNLQYLKLVFFSIILISICSCDINSCEKPIIDEKTNIRAINLVKWLLENAKNISPSNEPYSPSGITDLVHLGPITYNKLLYISKNYSSSYQVKLVPNKENNLTQSCVYDRQLQKNISKNVTHNIVIYTKDRDLLQLSVIYDQYRDKFHINGFITTKETKSKNW